MRNTRPEAANGADVYNIIKQYTARAQGEYNRLLTMTISKLSTPTDMGEQKAHGEYDSYLSTVHRAQEILRDAYYESLGSSRLV